MQHKVRRNIVFASSVSVLMLAGCAANVPRPDGQLQVTEAAIAAAEGADAREAAPILLNSAQDKLLEARTAIDREQYKTATWLLEDAEVEAKLAQAKAETAETQRAVNELQKSIENLQEQLNNQS